MNIRTLPHDMLDHVMEFMRPAFVQAAALCLRDTNHGPEVLLIQSLRRKHWIIPKGWPMKNRSLAEAAEIEAWEEAGVLGRIHPDPIGAFTYTKIKKSGLPVQCRPQVYRLDVSVCHDSYPEAARRTRKWVSLLEAAETVRNPQLAELLRNFS